MTESGTDLFLRGGDNKANQLADYTIDLNGPNQLSEMFGKIFICH